jgi:hypothetical protein
VGKGPVARLLGRCRTCLRILRAVSAGAPVRRTAEQRRGWVRRCAYFLTQPLRCLPCGLPGSVGHSYAMLRQQTRNMVGERNSRSSRHPPRPSETEHHLMRTQSEAAFASLAGVNSLPASSGNTVRHRLNGGGDRRLNRALHTITMTRMVHHPGTREYVAKRTQEGRGYREIRRSPSAILPEPSTVSSTPFTRLWIQPAHVLQGRSPANS